MTVFESMAMAVSSFVAARCVQRSADEVLLPIHFEAFCESGKDDQLSGFSCRNLHERSKTSQI